MWMLDEPVEPDRSDLARRLERANPIVSPFDERAAVEPPVPWLADQQLDVRVRFVQQRGRLRCGLSAADDQHALASKTAQLAVGPVAGVRDTLSRQRGEGRRGVRERA